MWTTKRSRCPALGLALIVALALFPLAGAAQTQIAGRASVIDGDTLDLHGQRIRLAGIDAPEAGQICADAAGSPWRCGRVAAFALDDRISGVTVFCVIEGQDRYGRSLGQCSAGGISLNRWLIRMGLALPYFDQDHRYAADQLAAQRERRGIWAGRFEPPSAWRKRNR